MSSSAAWQAQLNVSGTAVAMTAEATSLVSGTTYQVTNAAKRILDPTAAVTVKDGGTPVTPDSIDYLFGQVTLPAPPGGAVTIDASYLPTAALAECKSVDISVQAAVLDKSAFGTQAKQKLAGLIDYTATIGRLTLPLDDVDPVAGSVQSLDARMQAGTPMLLDWLVDGTNRVRAWLQLKGYKVGAQLDGLVEVNLDFEGNAQAAGAVISIGT